MRVFAVGLGLGLLCCGGWVGMAEEFLAGFLDKAHQSHAMLLRQTCIHRWLTVWPTAGHGLHDASAAPARRRTPVRGQNRPGEGAAQADRWQSITSRGGKSRPHR